MKKWGVRLAISVLSMACSLLGLTLLTGCGGLTHVDAAKFKKQMELNNMQTVYWCQYIGQADGKVYMLRKRAPLVGKSWGEQIWFTEVEKLDPEFVRGLAQKER